MLRHLDQHGGGVLVYTHSLLEHMLRLDSGHEFVLLYQNPAYLGRFAHLDRVTELATPGHGRLHWDQVVAPRLARLAGVEALFNPKYSLPLATRARTAFVSHGLDWYVMPWGSPWADRLSHRFLVPRYASKADRIIAVSETTREHVMRYLGVPEKRVETIYHGVDERFQRPRPVALMDRVRDRYSLPEQFLLYCGQIYPAKNFGRLLRAFAKMGPARGISLVVAGAHTCLCERELALIDELGIRRWVVEAGWIDRDILPAFYHLARALVLPSLYEACPSPILEAMATGCPIVTADRYGTAELAGPAAVLVDPENVDAIADGMGRVLDDVKLRETLIAAGARRVASFSWQKCATRTLDVLVSLERADAAHSVAHGR